MWTANSCKLHLAMRFSHVSEWKERLYVKFNMVYVVPVCVSGNWEWCVHNMFIYLWWYKWKEVSGHNCK